MRPGGGARARRSVVGFGSGANAPDDRLPASRRPTDQARLLARRPVVAVWFNGTVKEETEGFCPRRRA